MPSQPSLFYNIGPLLSNKYLIANLQQVTADTIIDESIAVLSLDLLYEECQEFPAQIKNFAYDPATDLDHPTHSQKFSVFYGDLNDEQIFASSNQGCPNHQNTPFLPG